MTNLEIMQGDAFDILVTLTDETGTDVITPDNASDVEITLGRFIKTYLGGGVSYDTENDAWVFPVSQLESFSMCGVVTMQARVKFSANEVSGVNVAKISILPSCSREVL